jgi:hypothetical protein
LQRNALQLIVRGHKHNPYGAEFTHQSRLVTIFSAPNYCGKYHNVGAILRISCGTSSDNMNSPSKKEGSYCTMEGCSNESKEKEDSQQEKEKKDSETVLEGYIIQYYHHPRGTSVGEVLPIDKRSELGTFPIITLK